MTHLEALIADAERAPQPSERSGVAVMGRCHAAVAGGLVVLLALLPLAMLAAPRAMLLTTRVTTSDVTSGLWVDDANVASSGLGSASGSTRVAGYDEATAKRLILASDAVYCGDARHGGPAALQSILDYTCPPCTSARHLPQGGALAAVKQFWNATRETFGLAGISDGWDSEHFVVSFRGTVTALNYEDDYDIACVTVPGLSGCVARGFYRTYTAIKDGMLEAVASLRSQFPHVTSVLVTGHSLGATQAVYGALDLAISHPDMRIQLYAFAPPMPGDAVFVASLDAVSNLKEYWNVVHSADTVPQCGIYDAPCPGQKAKGFRPIGHVVWYPGSWKQGFETGGYKMCRELDDSDCQGGVVPPSALNWDDHNLYLNHVTYCCDSAARLIPNTEGGPGCKWPKWD